MSEAERLAAYCDHCAVTEDVAVAPETFKAIAALLRTPAPAPAPEGWRVRDALVNLLDVLSLGPLGCAAKYGPDVDPREVEAAAFYQARVALDASPSPSAHAELAGRLRETLKSCLLVLCAVRNEPHWHKNFVKDIDFAIEACREAATALGDGT